jgi:hypothetical protein
MIGLAFLSKGNKGAALLASLFGILLVVVQRSAAFDPFSPSSGVAAQPITQTVAKNSIMVMPLA